MMNGQLHVPAALPLVHTEQEAACVPIPGLRVLEKK